MMGVRGLTTFMDEAFRGWQRQKIQGRIVIDGNSLLHRLYCSDWAHGGQYPEFRETILDFFHTLRKSEVQPVIVLDGVDYKQEKADVMIKRRNECICYIHKYLMAMNSTKPIPADVSGHIIPLLAAEVFQQVVCEVKVPIYVADGEADPMIVQIANHYSCPVVSSDSDFYLFNLPAGYIPLDRFHWKSTPIVADVYYIREFSRQFKFQDDDLRYIIPAIVGNDFILSVHSSLIDYIRRSISKNPGACNRVLPVVIYVSKFQSLSGFLAQASSLPHGDTLQTNCRKAAEMYCVDATQNPEDMMLTTIFRLPSGKALPEWLLRLYRLGRLPLYVMEALVLRRCVLRIVVEDSQRPSSMIAGQQLRQYIFMILGLQDVTELYRHDLSLSRHKYSGDCTHCLQVPNISEVAKLSAKERGNLFYQLLSCDQRVVEELEYEWRIVVATIMYWARNVHPPVHVLKALILCCLLCFSCKSDLSRKEYITSNHHWKNPKWMLTVHSFALWQCIYLDATTLNQLLMEPLKFISPAFLYDGKIAMHLALATVVNFEQKVANSPIDHVHYEKILRLILSQGSAVASELEGDDKSEASHTTKKPAKPQQTCSKFAHMNRFAPLQTSESEESD